MKPACRAQDAESAAHRRISASVAGLLRESLTQAQARESLTLCALRYALGALRESLTQRSVRSAQDASTGAGYTGRRTQGEERRTGTGRALRAAGMWARIPYTLAPLLCARAQAQGAQAQGTGSAQHGHENKVAPAIQYGRSRADTYIMMNVRRAQAQARLERVISNVHANKRSTQGAERSTQGARDAGAQSAGRSAQRGARA